MFLVNKKYDLAIAQIPKAGITSLRDWLRPGFEAVPLVEAMEYGTRVAFIRHPLERLKSSYSFFYWLKWRGSIKHEEIPTDSWEAFVDNVLSQETDNAHWRPQVEFTGDVPNIWHKFENIEEHWEKYYPGILGYENKSSRLETVEYRMSELLDKYADDLRLWEAAT